MTNEELNDALYKKMAEEQKAFRDWLIKQPPEQILNYSYEYSNREDILFALENYPLTSCQAKALLESSSPLADVYKDWMKTDDYYMEDIRDTIEHRANKEAHNLWDVPVYIQSGKYAREHGELDMYRASYKTNIACKEAIEDGIRDNYDGSHFDASAVYDDVAGAFGRDRVELVLATTIQHKDWDGRFSRDNKAWAQKVPMEKCFGTENDHCTSYVVDSHSVLTDALVSHLRSYIQYEHGTFKNLDDIIAAAKQQSAAQANKEVPKEETHDIG